MYIKTTYGIYNSKDVYSPDNPKPRFIFKKDTIAQADTIDKLIDFYEVNTAHYYDHYKDFCERNENYHETVTIYGCIRTEDNRNIRVAKFNNKGELELLWKD